MCDAAHVRVGGITNIAGSRDSESVSTGRGIGKWGSDYAAWFKSIACYGYLLAFCHLRKDGHLESVKMVMDAVEDCGFYQDRDDFPIADGDLVQVRNHVVWMPALEGTPALDEFPYDGLGMFFRDIEKYCHSPVDLVVGFVGQTRFPPLFDCSGMRIGACFETFRSIGPRVGTGIEMRDTDGNDSAAPDDDIVRVLPTISPAEDDRCIATFTPFDLVISVSECFCFIAHRLSP